MGGHAGAHSKSGRQVPRVCRECSSCLWRAGVYCKPARQMMRACEQCCRCMWHCTCQEHCSGVRDGRLLSHGHPLLHRLRFVPCHGLRLAVGQVPIRGGI